MFYKRKISLSKVWSHYFIKNHKIILPEIKFMNRLEINSKQFPTIHAQEVYFDFSWWIHDGSAILSTQSRCGQIKVCWCWGASMRAASTSTRCDGLDVGHNCDARGCWLWSLYADMKERLREPVFYACLDFDFNSRLYCFLWWQNVKKRLS